MIHETEIALVIRRVFSEGFLLVLQEVGTTFLEWAAQQEALGWYCTLVWSSLRPLCSPHPLKFIHQWHPSLMCSINTHTQRLSCNRAGGYFTPEFLPARIAAHNESAGLCLPWIGLPKTLTWFPLPPLSFHCEEPNGLWMQYSATKLPTHKILQ